MRSLPHLLALIAVVVSPHVSYEKKSVLVTCVPAAQTLEESARVWMQGVLDNWEAICRRHLHVAAEPLPWIIFYDESGAWHLNADETLLPSFRAVPLTLNFEKRTYALRQVAHTDAGLWVPGRDAQPVKPVAVTMLYADEQKPFFVIPLPSLFRKLAAADQGPALDELFLGLSLHELAHTRQLVDATRRLNRLRTEYNLPESLHDNLIQDTFDKDVEYKRLYEEERGHLMRAVLAEDSATCRQAVARALSVSQQRRERFFVGAYKGWAEVEDIFLALEGLGMWVHTQMARDHAPKGEAWQQTLTRLSENTAGAWSQEEGVGLFLLIDRLVPGWQRRFLAPNFPSPFAVLREAIRTRSRRPDFLLQPTPLVAYPRP